MEFKIKATLLAIVVASIVYVIFRFLNWVSGKTYRPTKTQIESNLSRVLNGTMTWDEWDEFICVPIRYNQDLDLIRRQCKALLRDEYTIRNSSKDQMQWIYNERGLVEIRNLLTSLEPGA